MVITDLECAEMIFAQKLASGERSVRGKALRRLRSWLRERSTPPHCLSKTDFLRLWKGLYYCVWMQDQSLIQEELADEISDLLDRLGDDNQRFLFIDAFFVTLAREWNSLDRWRLDKFLMLIRRFVRRSFVWIDNNEWSSEMIDRMFSIWQSTVLSPDSSIADGLKSHFVSLFLDELDLVGGNSLSREKVSEILRPFVRILTSKKTSDYLFTTLLDEVFVTILHQFSDESTIEETKEGIKFDYTAIGVLLANSSGKMKRNRRRRLGRVVRQFKMVADGRDPFQFDPGTAPDFDFDEELVEASDRLLQKEIEARMEKNRFRKGKRRLKTDDKDEVKEKDKNDTEDANRSLSIKTSKKRRKQPVAKKNKKRNALSD